MPCEVGKRRQKKKSFPFSCSLARRVRWALLLLFSQLIKGERRACGAKEKDESCQRRVFPDSMAATHGVYTHAASDKEKKGRNSSRRFSLFFFLFVFHEENDEKAARRTHIFGSVITPSATTLSSGQNKTWNSTSLRPHKLRMWSIALGPMLSELMT